MIKRIAVVAGAWLLAVAPAAQAQQPSQPGQSTGVADAGDTRRVAAAPELLRVYCAGAASADGFQSPDVADSARDLREALRGKKKTLRLVDDPQAADVQVIVDSRERSPRYKTVYATLVVGAHEERLVGSDDTFWTDAADEVADQVDRWLKFNRVRLMASRARAGNP